MNKCIVIGIILLLIVIGFSGCIEDRTSEVVSTSREFIKDYIQNPDTIQFNSEIIDTVVFGTRWEVYGSGTVEYEGNRTGFSYWIHVENKHNQLKYIVKQLIIGDI